MLFQHHRRCPNLAPASDQTSAPGGYLENTTHRPNAGPMWASVYWPNIGPAPGRCIVFSRYPPGAEVWSDAGARFGQRRWCWNNIAPALVKPLVFDRYAMYWVYHVWNRRIYYSVHKQRPTVRHDIEVKSVLHKWPERHASKDETLSTTPVQRWANIDDSGSTLD